MALQPPPQLRQRQRPSTLYARQALKCLLSGASLVFLITAAALADYKPDLSKPYSPTGSTGTRAYMPPDNSRPSGSTSPLGTRGLGSCGEASRGKLTALAPFSHVGQTIATRPTVAWYMPDTEPHTIEFRLSQYDSNGKTIPIGAIHRLQSKQGIMLYPLPLDVAGLTIGQKYRWQVTLICNASRRSKDQILETDIALVAMPAMLQASLAKTSDRLQRADLYAKAGFWYDALAEALATSTAKPFAIKLLEELMQLEPPGTPEKPGQQYTQLKQVVEIEQQ